MRMATEDRLEIVQEFFRARLSEEITRGGHGTAARIARATGISPPHLTNIVKDRSRAPGIDTMQRLAQHWGTTYAALEREALGGMDTERPADDPLSVAMRAARLDGHEEQAIEAVRDYSFKDGAALGWRDYLDMIEEESRRLRRERIDPRLAERAEAKARADGDEAEKMIVAAKDVHRAAQSAGKLAAAKVAKATTTKSPTRRAR